MAEKIIIFDSREVNVFLLQRFRDPKLGVKIKDRIYHGRIHSKCFIASEAIEWILKNTTAETKDDAISFGRHLQRCGFFYHVSKNHELKDEYLFFRLNKKFVGEIAPYTADMKKFYLMDQIYNLGTVRVPSKSKPKIGSVVFRKKSTRKTVQEVSQSMDFDLLKSPRKYSIASLKSSSKSVTSADPDEYSSSAIAAGFDLKTRQSVSFRSETPPSTLAGIDDHIQQEAERQAESKHETEPVPPKNATLPPPSLMGTALSSPVTSPIVSPVFKAFHNRSRTASIASSPSFRDKPIFDDE